MTLSWAESLAIPGIWAEIRKPVSGSVSVLHVMENQKILVNYQNDDEITST